MENNNQEFFRRADGFASSLVLNFLQLPVFTPSRTSYCTYASAADTADWMGILARQCPTSPLTLRDLVIPGTHNSASGSIQSWKPFSAVGRTQSASVREQLDQGARYLDLRIAPSSKGDDSISIWHGLLEGGGFDTVLDDIDKFMGDHPAEVVIVEVVPEFGKKFEGAAKQACLEMVSKTLGHRVIPRQQIVRAVRRIPFSRLALSDPKFGRLIVILHDRFFTEDLGSTEKEIFEKYNFVRRGKMLRNPWHNTRDVDHLLSKNLELVEEFGRDKRFFICNQFLATPGVRGSGEILGVLTGRNSLRPVSHACKLYQCGILDSFLRKHAKHPWNIVSLDYFELCPEVIDFLIGLNWIPYKLRVKLAAASCGEESHDVTAVCRSLVQRDCILFLVDPRDDLSVPEPTFNLVIAYSVDDGHGSDRHFVAEFNRTCKSPIILSPFSCGSEVNIVELAPERESRGIVQQGQILHSGESLCGKKLAVSFAMDDSGCNFELL